MRERLMPESEGLYLQKTRSSTDCTFSGERIPQGRHAVSVRQEVGRDTYIAWVSLGSVDALISALTNLDTSEDDDEVMLSPTENVKYATLNGRNQTCAVCGEQMEYQTRGVTLVHSKGGSHSMAMDVVWLHTDCTDELVDGLKQVWDYADDLLTEAL